MFCWIESSREENILDCTCIGGTKCIDLAIATPNRINLIEGSRIYEANEMIKTGYPSRKVNANLEDHY